MQRELSNGMVVENVLNRTDNSLPFGLFHPPSEGKLIWICNYDNEARIRFVYRNTNADSTAEYGEGTYADLKQALWARDEHIKDGWQPLQLPELQLNVGGQPLNRRQRRELQRKLNK